MLVSYKTLHKQAKHLQIVCAKIVDLWPVSLHDRQTPDLQNLRLHRPAVQEYPIKENETSAPWRTLTVRTD